MSPELPFDKYSLESIKVKVAMMNKLVNNKTNFAVEKDSRPRGSKKTNKVGTFHTLMVYSSPLCSWMC